MNQQLSQPLGHDSVWSFVAGADENQMRAIERRTGYELRLATPAGADSASRHAALYRPLSIQSDAELAEEHDRIAIAVHEIVRERWEVETLSFHAGTVIPTYFRLEWMDSDQQSGRVVRAPMRERTAPTASACCAGCDLAERGVADVLP